MITSQQIGATKTYLSRNAGSIDYATGKIFLRNFRAEYLDDGKTELSLTAIPRNRDIFARRNQIILIDAEGISVNAEPVKTVIDRGASDSAFTR